MVVAGVSGFCRRVAQARLKNILRGRVGHDDVLAFSRLVRAALCSFSSLPRFTSLIT